MAHARLYPPQYRQALDANHENVTVTLLNLERPTVWDEVSDWLDRNGSIANRQLREISGLDTLEASRMLLTWVAQGLLIALPSASRQQARYSKPVQPIEGAGLLSNATDNELQKS